MDPEGLTDALPGAVLEKVFFLTLTYILYK